MAVGLEGGCGVFRFMTIIPLQYFGIGDCIFTQTLVHEIAQGHQILWPVMPQFVEGLNRAYPDIKFVDYRDVQVDYNCRKHCEVDVPGIGRATLLPIRWADQLLNLPYNQCMRAKYDLYGLDWRRWRERAMWVRGKDSELYSIMGINELPYNLYNNTFGSEAKLKASVLQAENGISSIEMHVKPGFSLFDWAHIIQGATAIHTVSTSIIYLLEMLDLRAPEVHLYNRPIKGQGFDNVDYILQRHKYVLHG